MTLKTIAAAVAFISLFLLRPPHTPLSFLILILMLHPNRCNSHCDEGLAYRALALSSLPALDSPRQYSKHQVEHKKGSDDDEGNEVDPIEVAAHRVIGLDEKNCGKAFLDSLSLFGVHWPHTQLTHPVEYLRPPLHGDALKDGEHGVADVVEGGDAVVGSLPLL